MREKKGAGRAAEREGWQWDTLSKLCVCGGGQRAAGWGTETAHSGRQIPDGQRAGLQESICEVVCQPGWAGQLLWQQRAFVGIDFVMSFITRCLPKHKALLVARECHTRLLSAGCPLPLTALPCLLCCCDHTPTPHCTPQGHG